MLVWINVVCWYKQNMVANSHTKNQSVQNVFRSHNTFYYACAFNIQRLEDVGPFQLKLYLLDVSLQHACSHHCSFLYHPVYNIITYKVYIYYFSFYYIMYIQDTVYCWNLFFNICGKIKREWERILSNTVNPT